MSELYIIAKVSFVILSAFPHLTELFQKFLSWQVPYKYLPGVVPVSGLIQNLKTYLFTFLSKTREAQCTAFIVIWFGFGIWSSTDENKIKKSVYFKTKFSSSFVLGSDW